MDCCEFSAPNFSGKAAAFRLVLGYHFLKFLIVVGTLFEHLYPYLVLFPLKIPRFPFLVVPQGLICLPDWPRIGIEVRKPDPGPQSTALFMPDIQVHRSPGFITRSKVKKYSMMRMRSSFGIPGVRVRIPCSLSLDA